MKNIFLLTAGLGLALSFQSCKPDTTADDARYQQSIDSTLNVRKLALRDSVKMACNELVMSAATAYADSVMAAKAGKGGKPKAKPVAEPEKTGKEGKMDGGKDATQDKKDKMENAQQDATQKKKDKMNKPK